MKVLCFFGFHKPDALPTVEFRQTRGCLRCSRIEINEYDFLHATTKWVNP